MHQTSSKHPYSRTISITSDNPSEVFFSAEEDLTLPGNVKNNDRVPLGSARCSSLKGSLNNSEICQNESFVKLVFNIKTLIIHILNMICFRNHFGSETTIIPSSPAVLNNIINLDDTLVNRDHTVINIDSLEVIKK